MPGHRILILVLMLFLTSELFSQSDFDLESYKSYRKSNINLTNDDLQEKYPMPVESYFKDFENLPDLKEISYLDSTILKLNLTENEIYLLKQNLFFVTERLSFNNFGHAFHNVYSNDLPVFITTDAILHALHKSYDEILKTIEREIMSSNLEIFLESMYNNFQDLEDKYEQNELLKQPLKDAGLYISIAYSLIKNELQLGLAVDRETLTKVWDAIKEEKMTVMPLFAEHTRKIDFSQFKVRGHYVHTQEDTWQGLKSLEPYFKTMMWLGRIDFFLTPPPKNPSEEPWSEEDILRMNIDAFLVNELLYSSESLSRFQENEEIINYLVGESDNILTSEYQSTLNKLNINSVEQLLDTLIYNNYKTAVSDNPEFTQKILSNFFIMDPNSDKPDEIPISYRLSGQRFIIDSYILGNVVYDRIIYNEKKIWRPMPDPLDALFVLGNNNSLPLLEKELKKYNYGGQLANLRYLVDAKTEDYWAENLYNVWLNSIRKLNPIEYNEKMPLFMKSAAWQHEKINTQLSGWAQLRHDNLLYAKQSYTGGTACSFPYSYVEPYPEFYKTIKQFTIKAGNFFEKFSTRAVAMNQIKEFFRNFAEVCENLENLANKELNGNNFNTDDNEWLQSMLFVGGESGEPPFSGWYSNLFFNPWHSTENDFTIADIHTQPTDEGGNVVGKILHAGVGNINLGVFIADCPVDHKSMAFVGPVMSFYKKTTSNFNRMTDQEWTDEVLKESMPERPNWTNIYLADKYGNFKEKGVELPSKLYTSAAKELSLQDDPEIISVFPNPFTGNINVQIFNNKITKLNFKLINSAGVTLKVISEKEYPAGKINIKIDGQKLTSGFYILHMEINNRNKRTWKILKK